CALPISVPEAGVLAAEVLACELAKSWAGTGSCRLPKRVQNIVREGVTMTVMDQFEFLDDGMFGVYEVDTFIATFNPHRLQGPAWMIVPRFAGRRARRVRGPPAPGRTGCGPSLCRADP